LLNLLKEIIFKEQIGKYLPTACKLKGTVSPDWISLKVAHIDSFEQV